MIQASLETDDTSDNCDTRYDPDELGRVRKHEVADVVDNGLIIHCLSLSSLVFDTVCIVGYSLHDCKEIKKRIHLVR